MSRRNFAPVDALLIVICIVIFAGGVLASPGMTGSTIASSPAASATGDRP